MLSLGKWIKSVLPGDRVRARVTQIGKPYGRAVAVDILRASPDRRVAPCPLHDACGGCQLQHWSYEAQLRWKRQHVIDILERIGKLPVGGSFPRRINGAGPGRGSSTIGSYAIGSSARHRAPDPRHARSAAAPEQGAGADRLRRGRVGRGFFEPGTHGIVDLNTCLIQHGENEELIRAVKAAACSLGLSAYNRETGRGLLRHVVVRHAR